MRALHLAVACAVALAPAAFADSRPVRVAFVELVALDKSARAASGVVGGVIAAELARTGRVLRGQDELRDKKDLAAALLSCPGDACRTAAAEFGADYVLLASAAQLGKELALELKLVDPKKGAVVAVQSDVATRQKDIGPMTQRALQRLLAGAPLAVEELKQPVVVVTPPVEQPVEPPAPLEVTPPSVVQKASPSRLPAYVALGGGAAAAVVGGVLVGSALSFNQRKETLPFDEAKRERGAAQTKLVAGYALVTAGVAAAGAGVFLLLKPDAPAAVLVPTADGAVLSVSGRF